MQFFFLSLVAFKSQPATSLSNRIFDCPRPALTLTLTHPPHPIASPVLFLALARGLCFWCRLTLTLATNLFHEGCSGETRVMASNVVFSIFIIFAYVCSFSTLACSRSA